MNTDPRLSMLEDMPAEVGAPPTTPAAQSYERACELYKSQNPGDAYPLFVATAQADPGHAGAWYHMGLMLFQDHKYKAARACLERVNQIKPDNPRILTNLGWYSHTAEDTDAGLYYLKRAVEIGPDLALGWSNLSQIYIALSDLDAALRCAVRGLDLCSDGNPIHAMSLAFTHLFRGELLEGLGYYKARFRYKLQQFLAYAYPMWEGEKTGTLFLRAEQGIGDTVSTLRFLPEATRRADKTICFVNAELRTLVEDMRLPNTEVKALPSVLPAFADAWLPMMSLPLALRTSMKDLPAFDLPRYGKPATHDGMNIGVVWAGSKDMDMTRWRDVPLAEMISLLSMEGTRWVSLQKGDGQPQITTEGVHGILEDLSPVLIDMRETARVISSLDLVVTCCTSVAHLSAAMGKPTFVLRNRRASDWRWGLGSRESVPWYGDNVRIFERDYHEGWVDVVRRVREAILECQMKQKLQKAA